MKGAIRVYWTREDMKLMTYGNRLFITNFQYEDLGKYICVTYTSDNRRIERYIYLRPEKFGFISKPNKATYATASNTVASQKLPVVHIAVNENAYNDTAIEVICAAGELFIYIFIKYLERIFSFMNKIILEADQFQWYKTDGELSSRVSVEGNTIKIYRFNRDDIGEYNCIAWNNAGSSQASIYLGDEYETDYDAYIDVKSTFNGTVSLSCNAGIY